jgi:hypothetical protein
MMVQGVERFAPFAPLELLRNVTGGFDDQRHARACRQIDRLVGVVSNCKTIGYQMHRHLHAVRDAVQENGRTRPR